MLPDVHQRFRRDVSRSVWRAGLASLETMKAQVLPAVPAGWSVGWLGMGAGGFAPQRVSPPDGSHSGALDDWSRVHSGGKPSFGTPADRRDAGDDAGSGGLTRSLDREDLAYGDCIDACMTAAKGDVERQRECQDQCTELETTTATSSAASSTSSEACVTSSGSRVLCDDPDCWCGPCSSGYRDCDDGMTVTEWKQSLVGVKKRTRDEWQDWGPAEGSSTGRHGLYAPDYAGHCSDALLGSDTICSGLAADRTRTEDDFLDIDTSAYSDTVHIVGAEADEEGLIEYAWALLNENSDLIKWAVCWVTGDPDKGDRIVGYLSRSWRRVNVKVTESSRCADYDGDGYSDRIVESSPDIGFGGRIRFCRYHKAWQTALGMWADEGDVSVRACAALQIATMIVHELTHVSWLVSTSDRVDAPYICAASYMIQFAFLWAIFNRYSFATEGSAPGEHNCCGDMGGDSAFADDGTRGPDITDHNCDTTYA